MSPWRSSYSRTSASRWSDPVVTTMTATLLRPLPGFAFDSAAPVYDDVLPRMDVAVFAGFAARGPVNVPVPLEDAEQFAEVFGADASLAWDLDRGRVLQAQLAPAVRSFFMNGGKRCWVIRLTRGATSNALPVPGLAAVTSTGSLVPFVLCSSSPGSWSDGVEVSASLVSQRFGVRRWDGAAHEIEVVGPSGVALAVGDLLRITSRDSDAVLYAGVGAVTAHDAQGASPRRLALRIRTSDEQWVDIQRIPVQRDGTAQLGTHTVPVTFVHSSRGAHSSASDVLLSMPVAAHAAPRPGETLVVAFGAETLVVTVTHVSVGPDAQSPPAPDIRVRGDGVWRRQSAPASSPLPSALSVERLSLELWSRVAGGNPRRIGDLGLAPGHPRHVELLPSDDALYATGDVHRATWRDALAPRFPAAGSGAVRLCIPFALGSLPRAFLPAIPPDGAALERDGLVPFNASLFGDEQLANTFASTLLADAEYLRFIAPITHEPTGLHRVLAIEEATLLAVPDAAQPGWVAMEKGTPPPPDPSAVNASDPRDAAAFIDCGAVEGRGPWLEVAGHDATSSIALEWTAADGTISFLVEESTNRDWRGAIVVFQGAGASITIAPRQPGDYYYRVRGIGDHPTEWSNGVGVRLAGASAWRARRPSEYRDDVLVAAQRMLLRVCAARRDMMAVLSLPAHYRDGAALAHAQLLGATDAPVVALGSSVVPPLSMGERDALGFAALYHGWLVTRDDNRAQRAIAPDGAACGVIARRGIERGAWVAPANEVLRGVIALEQPAAPSRWQDLQQLAINTMRHTARGFMVMSADTLAGDDDLRPIAVRRLLILLRRVALRLGATYVFEPNNDSFRRMVQRRFEAMLGDLFQRGAFAGSSAATAFQVHADASLNTPASKDTGQFVVELRVAPSRPMTFLTIRLLQTGERITVSGG